MELLFLEPELNNVNRYVHKDDPFNDVKKRNTLVDAIGIYEGNIDQVARFINCCGDVITEDGCIIFNNVSVWGEGFDTKKPFKGRIGFVIVRHTNINHSEVPAFFEVMNLADFRDKYCGATIIKSNDGVFETILFPANDLAHGSLTLSEKGRNDLLEFVESVGVQIIHDELERLKNESGLQYNDVQEIENELNSIGFKR